MSDIIEFLNDRLDEDEARAQHALNADLDHLPTVECRCGRRLHLGGDADRALREVEAKRAIILLHAPGEPWCDCGTWDTTVHGESSYEVCPTIQALAAVYADHPEYDLDTR